MNAIRESTKMLEHFKLKSFSLGLSVLLKIAGSSKELSGSSKELSGSSKELSGSTKELSRSRIGGTKHTSHQCRGIVFSNKKLSAQSNNRCRVNILVFLGCSRSCVRTVEPC